MRTYVAVKEGVTAGNLATCRLPASGCQAREAQPFEIARFCGWQPGNLATWQPGFLSCRKRNGARAPPA
jgi:hypothetical protein